MTKPLTPEAREAFDALINAFTEGEVALISAVRKRDGVDVALLCLMAAEGDTVAVMPVAELLGPDAVEEYDDPLV